MAELITSAGRKSIKKIAQISQVSRALSLMPTAEDFAMRLIGDMKKITNMMNRISTRINEILDRYSNIPSEFLLKGFDEILKKLHDIDDYTKFAIKETIDVMSSTVKSTQEITGALGSAVSEITSATLQIGGGLTYGAIAMSANITLAVTGNGRRSMTNDVVQDVINGEVPIDEMDEEFENRIDSKVGGMDSVADAIRDWTEGAASKSTESIDAFFENAGNGMDTALDWISETKENADGVVDDSIGVLIEKVENAKRDIEEKIETVKITFDKFTKNFDEAFGFINGKNFAEEAFRNASNTAYEKMDGPVFDAIGECTEDIADFIKNFNIGKVITAIGGMAIGAASATLVMDLLPSIDVDRMLKDIVSDVDTRRIDKMTELYYNKYYESSPDLVEVTDSPWRVSVDDLEKYSAENYNKYLNDYGEENSKVRNEIFEKMNNVESLSNMSSFSKDMQSISKENKAEMEKNKSALKAMRKVRREAIKAKQIERYKGFLKIELDYLEKEFLNLKNNIKYEWDSMMEQYKNAVKEITNFFSKEGCGGSEIIDKCCDRINDDATQIVELCKNITIELTSTVSKIPTPYAIGTCVDMPVHKILSFFMDIKIVLTFLKNLIRLGIDILSQLTILAKLIANGFKSLKEIFDTLKELIGVDKILNMIEFLIELFRPKVIDAKILLENSISPIYYNETKDYEDRVAYMEDILGSDISKNVDIKKFNYTDDPYARKKYRGKEFGGKTSDEDEIEEWLEELEAKGEREIVAYRSPILNAEGDDFAGWIYYYADAYDNMKGGWGDGRKRRKNKLIKKASKKNKLIGGKLVGGVAQLKKDGSFGYTTKDKKYVKNSVTGFDAYYWYTEWTNDPTDCVPDWSNEELVYDKDGNVIAKKAINSEVVVPVQTTANGSLVELSDGRRVFVEGKIVKSGDFVNVNGVKYRVK